MCTALPLYVNEELRAITKNQRSFDSAVIMSPLIPSEKYSCSGSPLMLMKGSTAIAGRSGSGKARGVSSGGCLSNRSRLVAGWLHLHAADEGKALAGNR